jgi:hypothetical protein
LSSGTPQKSQGPLPSGRGEQNQQIQPLGSWSLWHWGQRQNSPWLQLGHPPQGTPCVGLAGARMAPMCPARAAWPASHLIRSVYLPIQFLCKRRTTKTTKTTKACLGRLCRFCRSLIARIPSLYWAPARCLALRANQALAVASQAPSRSGRQSDCARTGP